MLLFILNAYNNPETKIKKLADENRETDKIITHLQFFFDRNPSEKSAAKAWATKHRIDFSKVLSFAPEARS